MSWLVRLPAAGGCYPLATAVYITARKSKCNLTTDPQRTTTASLLEWLLLYSNVAQALRAVLLSPHPSFGQAKGTEEGTGPGVIEGMKPKFYQNLAEFNV